jgi:hypothetical protein
MAVQALTLEQVQVTQAVAEAEVALLEPMAAM